MEEIPDLTDDEWLELLERLTLRAVEKLRKLIWRGVPFSKGGKVPGGRMPEDFAVDAIRLFLEGKRKWDKSNGQTLVQFLLGVVDSLISNAATSLENTATVRAPHDAPAGLDSFRDAKLRDPSEVAGEKERSQRVRTAIKTAIGEDGLVGDIFDCLEADLTKPSEIAEYLDISVQDVYTAQKRLMRKARKAYARLGEKM